MPPVKRKYPNIPDGFMAEAKRIRVGLKRRSRNNYSSYNERLLKENES